MKFFKVLAVSGSFLSFALFVGPVDAATVTFNWTLTGPAPNLGGVPFPGSGTITGTTLAGGDVMATSITGTVNGSMITGLNSSTAPMICCFQLGQRSFLRTAFPS
jgi:hypothetical protein